MISPIFTGTSADKAVLDKSRDAVGSPIKSAQPANLKLWGTTRAVEAKALQVTEAPPFLIQPLVREFAAGEEIALRTMEAVELGISKPYVAKEEPAGSSVDNRAKEKAWIKSHSEELGQFADEWIVVEGEQLIAHDPEFANAAKKARAQGIQIPYVTRIHSLGTRLSIGYQWKRKKSI